MKGENQNLRNAIIFDTSALFNFGHRGEMEFILEKLKEEYEIIIPLSVEKQTQIKMEYKAYYQKLIAEYFTIKSWNSSLKLPKGFETLVQRLGEADTDVIALGLEKNGTVIIDDRKARKESKALGLHVMGTVGIIHYCIQRNWLTQEKAIQIVKKLIERGSRIPIPKDEQTFEEYFKSLGE